MIELITVLILIGITAATVLPKMGMLSGFDEIAYRDKVRASLEYARKSAVALRRYVCVRVSSNLLTVTFDIRAPETVGATFCDGSASEAALRLPGNNSSTPNILPVSGSASLTGTASFSYSPLGQPSAAASYTVNGTQTVTVETVTGYVR